MSTKTVGRAQAAEMREEWVEAVRALLEQARRWAQEAGWQVKERECELAEEPLGVYHVPMLEVDTPQGRVVLEPKGRNVAGAEGRVDFYAWPTHYDVMLLREKAGDWVIRTSGLKWPFSWSQETFKDLASRLLEAP